MLISFWEAVENSASSIVRTDAGEQEGNEKKRPEIQAPQQMRGRRNKRKRWPELWYEDTNLRASSSQLGELF